MWSEAEGGELHVPLATPDEKWPTTFSVAFPTRQRPLDIFLVCLHATSQLWWLSPEHRASRTFAEKLSHIDYFLSLCECETATSWRIKRPTTLPFPAPAAPRDNAIYPPRSFEWPAVLTRAQRAQRARSDLETFHAFSTQYRQYIQFIQCQ